jgi:hypothetical protein
LKVVDPYAICPRGDGMEVGVGEGAVVGVEVGLLMAGMAVLGPQAMAAASSRRKSAYFRTHLGILYDSFGDPA